MHAVPGKAASELIITSNSIDARTWEPLCRTWRHVCGNAPEPSAVVIDSRSCRSAPSCFDRGIDGGTQIRGVKIHVAVDKYAMRPAIDVSRANRQDTKGSVPVRMLASVGNHGAADIGQRNRSAMDWRFRHISHR